MMDRRTVRNI